MRRTYISTWAEKTDVILVGHEKRMSGHRGELMQLAITAADMSVTIYDLDAKQVEDFARRLAAAAGLNVIN